MKRLLTSCFGLGYLPVAPGTWGSLPPTIIFALLSFLHISAAAISIVMVVLAALGSFVCVKFAAAAIEATGKKDPGEVVADEFAGQAVTFLAIFQTIPANHIFTIAMLGFLIFRFFDITKPWPIRKLEKLPHGWGILADDLLAGMYAAVLLLICTNLFFMD